GDRARHTVAKNAYRLRERDEADNRIKYHKRQEIIYARTDAERRRWREADTRMIVAAPDRTEERVTQVINAERDVLADLARVLRPGDERGGGKGRQKNRWWGSVFSWGGIAPWGGWGRERGKETRWAEFF